jgi:predicted dehydrogenase
MSTPLSVVFVGCGGIMPAWTNHLKSHPGVRVVGLVDLNQAQADKRKAEFGFAEARTGTDLAAMLGQVKADAVFDLTIPDAHADNACLALSRGCHVFSEKPMAADMAGALRILAAAKQANRLHAVMQNRRWLPDIRRCRDTLRGGAIGRLTELHADFFIGAHFGGFRDKMAHVLLLDMAVHTFDQARFLTGADPVAVNALEWNPPGSWYDRDASALVCAEMSDGSRVTYRGSWCSEGCNTSWEAQWRAIGQHGSLLWDGGASLTGQRVEPQAGSFMLTSTPIEPPPAAAMPVNGHAAAIDDFLDAVRTGRRPETPGDDNVKSLAFVHAAIASADRQGARVAISEIMKG